MELEPSYEEWKQQNVLQGRADELRRLLERRIKRALSAAENEQLLERLKCNELEMIEDALLNGDEAALLEMLEPHR